jgi:hypothetical protein
MALLDPWRYLRNCSLVHFTYVNYGLFLLLHSGAFFS